MWIWIIVAVIALAAAVWALWPRGSGIADGEVRRRQRATQAEVEEFRRPDQGGGIGMI